MGTSYLDLQARIGISVHLGGWPATRRLLSLCRVAEAGEVLDVGCGIGVGAVGIAREFGCRVVGVDTSPQMVEWARRRARAAGVGGRVSFAVGDVLALPFEDGRFDVVIAESVLAFVGDKQMAIAEMVRVARPGGYVGLNEGYLLTETPPPRVAELARQIGGAMVTLGAWLCLTRAAVRPVLGTMLASLRRGPDDEPGSPPPWASFGYGLFVGRKRPASPA